MTVSVHFSTLPGFSTSRRGVRGPGQQRWRGEQRPASSVRTAAERFLYILESLVYSRFPAKIWFDLGVLRLRQTSVEI